MLVWYIFGAATLYGATPDLFNNARWVHRKFGAINAVVPLSGLARIEFGLIIILYSPMLLSMLLGEPIGITQGSVNPIANVSATIHALKLH